MSEPPVPGALVYCRVWFGAGHWFRIAALMEALVTRFRVTAIVDGALTPDMSVPDGVDVRFLPAVSPAQPEAVQRRVDTLLALLHDTAPAVLILEYFPFGRREVSLELMRLIQAARKMAPPPIVVSSLRDIEQRTRIDAERVARETVMLANRYLDAVFVHADPALVRLDETFSGAADLTIPVHHTGYVVPAEAARAPVAREPRIVVSAGGGCGGEALLFAAIRAQAETDLSRDFSMRVIAGTLLPEKTWHQLRDAAQNVPRLELLRWVPNLREELACAAVSVSRCGYNTALDLVRSRVPALVVPYATPTEDEQTNRAHRLEHAGLMRTMREQRGGDPKAFAEEVRRTARFEPRAATIDCNGGPKSVALLESMLNEVTPCSS